MTITPEELGYIRERVELARYWLDRVVEFSSEGSKHTITILGYPPEDKPYSPPHPAIGVAVGDAEDLIQAIERIHADEGPPDVIEVIGREYDRLREYIGEFADDPLYWLGMVTEKTGQVASEITSVYSGGNRDRTMLRRELIKLAARAAAAADALTRTDGDDDDDV